MPKGFSKKKPILKGKSKASVNDTERTNNFKLSFQYLDTTQRYGSSFKDWQQVGLLSKALETLQGYCCSPLLSQVDGDKFAIYGAFPASNFTLFEYPQNVLEDANWARIHITGPCVVVGHIVNDTFYIVFLDKTHKFWLTKKSRKE
jgi:hypothetical protein